MILSAYKVHTGCSRPSPTAVPSPSHKPTAWKGTEPEIKYRVWEEMALHTSSAIEKGNLLGELGEIQAIETGGDSV